MKKRAVFLDRDGVINRWVYNAELGTVDSPANPGEFQLLPGAREAIAALNRFDLSVIVVSNQSGIAKSKFTPRALDAINEEMRVQLASGGARLDAVLYCRHDLDAILPEYRVDCECRKPKPGLFLRAASERNIDLTESFLIGDDVSDILAGHAAGVTTLLLSPQRSTVSDEFSSCGAIPDVVVQNLSQAVSFIREAVAGKLTIAAMSRAGSCLPAREELAPTSRYLRESPQTVSNIDPVQIERAAILLRSVREEGGRLFLLGAGACAVYASQAACDFRKIAGIEAYCVPDNASDLTAPLDGKDRGASYRSWLCTSHLGPADMLFVFSMDDGDVEERTGANLAAALQYARERGSAIIGIVSRNGGATAQLADVSILVPAVSAGIVIPHVASFQALVWRLLVSHLALSAAEAEWQSVNGVSGRSAQLSLLVFPSAGAFTH